MKKGSGCTKELIGVSRLTRRHPDQIQTDQRRAKTASKQLAEGAVSMRQALQCVWGVRRRNESSE